MAAILFKAQLIDHQGKHSAELARILYGVESVEEKELVFRALCQEKYPQLTIEEPIYIKPATSELK